MIKNDLLIFLKKTTVEDFLCPINKYMLDKIILHIFFENFNCLLGFEQLMLVNCIDQGQEQIILEILLSCQDISDFLVKYEFFLMFSHLFVYFITYKVVHLFLKFRIVEFSIDIIAYLKTELEIELLRIQLLYLKLTFVPFINLV